MIGKKMEEALNKQINAELYSSYLYLSMAACFESINLGGFAQWMYVQAQEEQGHAMRLYKHITDRGGRVSLDAIDKPKGSWSSPLEAFEDAYAHEQKVTGMIHDLVDQAGAEKDHAAAETLQWFVSEQVEEEQSTGSVAEKLKMIKDSPNGLFMMDHALGARKGD